VVTSTGTTLVVPIARWKNRRAALAARRGETNTSITWPDWAIARYTCRHLPTTFTADDLHRGLVHLPAHADGVPAWPGSLGQQRRGPLHPPVDGDMVNLDATLDQQLLDVVICEAEAQVPADREHDDIGREAEAGKGGAGDGSGAWAACTHAGSLAGQRRSPRTQQRLIAWRQEAARRRVV
jgi:hypothetical protein